MKAITWIIIGVAIAGIGYYAYKKSKKSENTLIDKIAKIIKKEQITTETCEVIKQKDVTSFFKSLPLIKGRHIPFVARASKFTQFLDIPNGEYNVMLGVYDELSDELSSVKIIVAKTWDTEFATMIGKEELIVLC